MSKVNAKADLSELKDLADIPEQVAKEEEKEQKISGLEVVRLKTEFLKDAKFIYDDIYEHFRRYITDFYEDYNPIKYHRMFAMPSIIKPFNASDVSFDKDYKGYTLTIQFNDEGMSSKHGDESQYVYEGPFKQGFHGPPWGRGGFSPAPQMVPSPFESIKNYGEYTYGAKFTSN